MSDPILLTDEQIQQFICDGFLMLEPDVDDDVHDRIDRQFNWLVENEPNPGNNILPRLPELDDILNCDVVVGAMTSLLGSDYLVHPHRFWHARQPNDEPLTPEQRVAAVGKASHQDAYTPAVQGMSHFLQYLRFMYYSHDMAEVNGPTHVAPGTQYDASISDATRRAQQPVVGRKGAIFISHFDLAHAGCPNLANRCRNMIKFIFVRRRTPEAPTWAHTDDVWRTPANQAPAQLDTCWVRQWEWLRGESPTFIANSDAAAIESAIGKLGDGEQADRTRAIYDLAEMGPPAVDSLIQRLKTVGINHPCEIRTNNSKIAMDDSAYALAAIGEPAYDGLLPLLADDTSLWTRLCAIHAINDIGIYRADVAAGLIGCLAAEDVRVQMFACNALGRIQAVESIPALLAILQDFDPNEHLIVAERKINHWPDAWMLHFNAALALARLGELAADHEDALIDLLKHPFGQVSFFIIDLLRQIGTPSAITAVLDHLASRHWDASLSKTCSF